MVSFGTVFLEVLVAWNHRDQFFFFFSFLGGILFSFIFLAWGVCVHTCVVMGVRACECV